MIEMRQTQPERGNSYLTSIKVPRLYFYANLWTQSEKIIYPQIDKRKKLLFKNKNVIKVSWCFPFKLTSKGLRIVMDGI